ncbi:MAG: FAD-dependent oxidoreductase [Chloroflexota bacterium]
MLNINNPDVIIIGAGIIGCAIAFELSKAGYKTLNIDKNKSAGAGSTINSCAIVRMGYSTYDGVAMAHECFQYWQDWPGYLGAADSSGLAQFVNRGTIMLLSPEPRSQRMLQLFDEVGVEYELWDAQTLRQNTPFMNLASFYPPTRMAHEQFWADGNGEIDGAIYIRNGGYVTDPQLATHNLMAAAQAHGAEFWFGTPVISIRDNGGRISGVTLSDGMRANSPIVINVAGPHSALVNRMAGVTGDMQITTRALRHEVHFIPAEIDEIAQTASHFSDADTGVYFRPEAGDALLVGSKDPECDTKEWVDNPDQFNRRVTQDQWKHQIYRLAKRLPGIRIPTMPKGVADLYDVSDDWIPIYDKSSLPGFYMAIGTSGNQFKNAAPAGHLIARLIHAVENGHDHDQNPLRYNAVYSGLEINVGFYSRLREMNPDSSYSVSG